MDGYQQTRFSSGNVVSMEYNGESGMFVVRVDDQVIAKKSLRGKDLLPILGMYHEGTRINMT